MHEATGLGCTHVLGAGVVGEVEHHQRLEAAAGRARSENALAIGVGFGGVAYRRNQVGHDDGAAESACGIADGVWQHRAIAQVNVPVIGTQESQAVGHGGFQAGKTWPHVN